MWLNRLLGGNYDLPVEVMTNGTVRISDKFFLWRTDLRFGLDTNRATLARTGPLGTKRVQVPIEEVRVTIVPSVITAAGGGRFPHAAFEATFWVGNTSFIASKQYVKKHALEYLRALNVQVEDRLTIEEQDVA